MKLKFANVLVIIVVLITSGCAKKVLMKHAEPEAKQECEDNFYAQFHTLTSDNEEGELKSIKTLSECREFLDKFWSIRDTDPTTPQNEYKDEKEELASDIKNEIMFSRPGTTGFSFKNSGGFTGDPAKVYMLHGMPDYTETLDHGYTYVNLMLWIYFGEEGKHKYRFLFYHKNGHGNFVILRPHFDIVYNLQEINKNPTTTHPIEILNELERENNIFLYSMVYFSDYPSESPDKAMRPPRPASEIAKELAPKIIDEQPQKEEMVISNSFGSFIPAELAYKIDNESLILEITFKHTDLDWIIKNGELVAELFIKIKIWNDNQKHEEEHSFDVVSVKEKIEQKRSSYNFELNQIKISEQSLKVSVYIKNNNKYNALIEEIKK